MPLNVVKFDETFETQMYIINGNILYIAFQDYGYLQDVITRASEYHENKHFMGKYFTYNEFKAHYLGFVKTNGLSLNASDNFTFGRDWSGFNLSGRKMEMFWQTFDDIDNGRELSQDEQWLKSTIVKFIDTVVAGGKMRNSNDWYLICTDGNCLPETCDAEIEMEAVGGLLAHELRHAFYYLDQNYNNVVYENWNKLSDTERDCITQAVDNMGGYNINNTDLVIDEAQAYGYINNFS